MEITINRLENASALKILYRLLKLKRVYSLSNLIIIPDFHK